MAVENLKSPAITSLDTIPPLTPTTGEGAPGYLKQVNGAAVASAGSSIGSTYRLVRIPTNAKIKRVELINCAAQTAGAVDIDVAYSDSTVDFTPPSLQGTVVQISGPADNKLFGSAVSLASAIARQDQTFANTFTATFANTPLWQLSIFSLTQDPGGFFDILLKVTTAFTTGGQVAVNIEYVE